MALTTIDTYGIKDGAVQIDDIGTLAGNLTINDSGKLRLGTGLDLQLYHDGSNSYITEASGSTPGDLLIQANNIKLRNWDGGQTYLHGSSSGSVDLYHDGNKKFETTSDGVSITGLLAPAADNSHDLGSPSLGWKNIYLANDIMLKDDGIIKLGDGEDLQFFHDGAHSYIRDVGTGDLKITSDGNGVMLQKASTENLARFLVDGACELYYDNTKKFESNSNGIKIKDAGGTVDTHLLVKGGEGRSAEIYMYADEGDDAADKWRISNTANDAYMQIQNYGAGSWQNNIRLEERGGVELYYANTKVFALNEHGAECYYSHGVMQFRAGSATDDDVFIKDGSINFDSVNNGNSIGWISLYGHLAGVTQYRDVKIGHGKGGGYCTFDGSAGTITGDFVDTSDERLKKNIVSLGNEGLTKIKQLRPVSFTWRNTDRNSYGFIAQEVETVLPNAVETNDTDPEEFKLEEERCNAIGEVVVRDQKGINTNSITAYLAKAVQELSAEVDTLKTKVAALEAA